MAIKELLNKYILVCKCDSIDQALQQKKGRLKILILAGIFAAAYVGFSLIPLAFFETLSGIMMLPFVVCFVVGIITFSKANQEVKRLQLVICDQCGKKFNLADVEYHFLNERRSTGNPDNQGMINFTVVHRYRFHCKCAGCGTEREFDYDFIQNQGKIQDKVIRYESPVDVEASIENFFA